MVKIGYKALSDKFVGNQQTSMLEISKLVCWKPATSKKSKQGVVNDATTQHNEICTGN